MNSLIDYNAWMHQPLIWGERCRGRSLVWTRESDWFINDPLGPTPHSHDDATEVAFLAQGSMEIEVGGERRLYSAGDFLLMPPDKFHNYWLHGEDPVCLFVLVAPNHKYHRFRTRDFPPTAHQGGGAYAQATSGAVLPSNAHIQSEVKALAPGESEGPGLLNLQDRVIYVLDGVAQVQLGSLSGPVGPHQYQYLPATFTHEIRNAGVYPLRYISMLVTDSETAHGTEIHE